MLPKVSVSAKQVFPPTLPFLPGSSVLLSLHRRKLATSTAALRDAIFRLVTYFLVRLEICFTVSDVVGLGQRLVQGCQPGGVTFFVSG